jgi:hypothetical protein
MTRVLKAACAALLLVALIAPSAVFAQSPACASRAELLARWAEKYGEWPLARGFMSNGLVLEIWATPDGAQWTGFVTRPDGTSCMVANGSDWESGQPPAAPGRPS